MIHEYTTSEAVSPKLIEDAAGPVSAPVPFRSIWLKSCSNSVSANSSGGTSCCLRKSFPSSGYFSITSLWRISYLSCANTKSSWSTAICAVRVRTTEYFSNCHSKSREFLNFSTSSLIFQDSCSARVMASCNRITSFLYEVSR